jgi:hypothetical protein
LNQLADLLGHLLCIFKPDNFAVVIRAIEKPAADAVGISANGLDPALGRCVSRIGLAFVFGSFRNEKLK